MKIAKVIALFKKGEKFLPKNYRPFSLLSMFNQIFEKLLCKQLVSFNEHNKILYNYQFGFRKLYSTTMALIEFSDNIHRLLDDGNYVIGILSILLKHLILSTMKFYYINFIDAASVGTQMISLGLI